MVQLTNW